MKRTVVVLAAVALMSASTFAAVTKTIAAVDSYDVAAQLKTDGFPVTTGNTWASKWVTDALVDAGSLGISGSLSIPEKPAYNQYSAVGWDTAGQYFSFLVDLADGASFEDDVQLYYGGNSASKTGPKNGWTSIIVDGGSEITLRSYGLTTSYQNFVDDLAGILDGANTVEIRFHAEGATSNLGTYRIGDYYLDGGYTDMGLYGTVVPEPATMALLGIGALALIRRRK